MNLANICLNYFPMIIVFHFPGTLLDNPISGSSLRPQMILKGFLELGHKVIPITGTLEERKKAIKDTRRRIASGMEIDFVYTESGNLPNSMMGASHVPRRPILDHRFFHF